MVGRISARRRYRQSLPAGSVSSSRAEVAQLVEHVTENHGVGSSILPLGTNTLNNLGELPSVMLKLI